MLSFNKNMKAIVGIAIFAAVATVGCGKSKGGGGGTAATAPDCTTSACTVGQGYASGVFFRSVQGQGRGNNKSALAKLAFFGQNSAGLNMSTNPVTYNGAFVATGTMRFTDGAYYGVSSTATRATAGFGFTFDIGFSMPNYNYNNGYNSGGGYYYPCGYNDPYCNGGGHNYPQPCLGSNCAGGGNYGQCAIPAGDYSVTTVAAGNFSMGNSGYGYGYGQESFTNLKLRFTSGGTVVDASINQGQLNGVSNGTTSVSTLRGQMVITSVNNVQCNQTVQF